MPRSMVQELFGSTKNASISPRTGRGKLPAKSVLQTSRVEMTLEGLLLQVPALTVHVLEAGFSDLVHVEPPRHLGFVSQIF